MYSKILAPMDGSTLGECTIAHVKEIAKGCNVPEVIFLFVIEVARNASWGGFPAEPAGVDALKKAAEAEKKWADSYLQKLVARAKTDGLMAKGVLLEGSPAEAIVDYVKKNGVDLIVMSTHGRSGVTRFALGSVTDKVIRSVSVPVMVVTPAECKV
jgi:nucleotide-binding universal stress UspA family protein